MKVRLNDAFHSPSLPSDFVALSIGTPAYTIYNFFYLLVAYVGTRTEVSTLNGPMLPAALLMCCIIHSWKMPCEGVETGRT